jgi:uncharacterized protein (DUF2384 family)
VSVYVDEFARVKSLGHLSNDDLAYAVRASVNTVRSWFRRDTEPNTAAKKRIVELTTIVERLAGVMSPDYIPVWLQRRVPALDDRKPIDVIHAGEYETILRLISELDEQGVS